MIEKINTYEGRELGVHIGELKQIVKPAWQCTKCNMVFFNKEEAEIHATTHRDSNNKGKEQ